MRYEHYDQLPELLEKKLISRRPHPTLPLEILNYTSAVMSLKIDEWPEALQDCRGLILEQGTGEVVGRPFRKFWNYEQVLDKIPSDEPFEVWEKLDGSLGIMADYDGHGVFSTRGSFESEQAVWTQNWLDCRDTTWTPKPGLTYLFEIIYPANRIVVDYGERKGLTLLAVINADGTENREAFDGCKEFPKAKLINWNFRDPQALTQMERYHPGEEGFVVRWKNGFRAKVKFEEYKRLHRLITQVSTRSIWELLRAGKGCSELMERVPQDFKNWVEYKILFMMGQYSGIMNGAYQEFSLSPARVLFSNRKEFAEWAKKTQWPHLMFALYDQKAIGDLAWRMIEPKWSTPFRKEQEG